MFAGAQEDRTDNPQERPKEHLRAGERDSPGGECEVDSLRTLLEW